MNFNSELKEMFENAERICNALSALVEKSGAMAKEDQLAALSLMEMIGATFIILGQEMENQNQQGVTDAFDTAKNLHEKAIEILERHSHIAA